MTGRTSVPRTTGLVGVRYRKNTGFLGRTPPPCNSGVPGIYEDPISVIVTITGRGVHPKDSPRWSEKAYRPKY